MTTQPADEATTDLTAAVVAAVENAWNDHARTKCNVDTGRALSQCACICGEVLSQCRPSVQAEHRRARLAEALAPVIRAERAAAQREVVLVIEAELDDADQFIDADHAGGEPNG